MAKGELACSRSRVCHKPESQLLRFAECLLHLVLGPCKSLRRVELRGSTYPRLAFDEYHRRVFLFLLIFFSPTSFTVRIQYVIHQHTKIYVTGLDVVSKASSPIVVQFWGIQMLHSDFQLCWGWRGWACPNPPLFQGPLYWPHVLMCVSQLSSVAGTWQILGNRLSHEWIRMRPSLR